MRKLLERSPLSTRQDRQARAAGTGVGLGLALVFSLIVALALSGCGEGYPSDDRVLVSPFEMNNAQRIAELNHVGSDARAVGGNGRQWRYTLEDSCHLEVEHRRRGGAPVATRVALTRTMDAEVAFDDAGKTYDVVLVDHREDPPVRVGTLLKSEGWTHATQAGLLLDLVIRDCARPAAAAR
ncbi:MAG: hypothetical protein J7598_05625 [Mitsuaria chitosanitabida]|jgi:hypothetical protein|uniref:hypothetical protein n=1 Tax=Roseateles chitosanitabidus TaxID=65048 RepID=UPI001B0A99E4|nr:hypothetical protein [Roseateles chitosanitabidus]MBO9686074.1 hypothetical protein [Roseateles chitosanitabidus]